jgi:hypothetical protein
MKEPKATSLWEYDGITYEFKTPNLLKFLAVSRNFQAADWLESERSKVVNYRRKSPVKTACLCPLHLEHNNAGNPRDDGFHVNNATEAHSWSMACSHGSGPHHRVQDRAIFLDVLCTMAGVEDARDLLKFTRRVDAA